jgi:3-oxoacyl-[acyl-carrier protein] reductase
MEKKQQYHGRAALVTASGTDIDRAVAMECARVGATVVLHFIFSAEGAASAVQEISQSGGAGWASKMNMASVEAIRILAKESLARLGGMDVLVNNAGITMNRSIDEVTSEQFGTLY